MSGGKLTLDDIADVRAYERERSEFRARVIELKRRRRLSLGPVLTLVFENRDTVRFQIQEMARVERLASDEAIQTELDTYNPLIPGPGVLCATLFLELTTEEAMTTWLPALVGIERSLVLRCADGTEIRSRAEAQHQGQLTRETVTAAVHFVQFDVDDAQAAALGAGAVSLVCDHPAYPYAVALPAETVAELRSDLA